MRTLAAGLVILFTLWVAFHVGAAELAKDNPPLACQLAGGTWSIWSGWQCR
jgi:hypothetical protein